MLCGHVGLGVGNGVGVGVFVVYGCDCVGRDAVVESTAVGAELGTHPVCVAGLTSRFHDDIGTLTNTQSDDIGLKWFDWDEILGDDGELVTIDAELLDTFGASVYQAEQVLLAGLKFELGDTGVRITREASFGARILHLAVDEVVIGRRDPSVHGVVDKSVIVGMEPIFNQDRANVYVVFGVFGAVDDQRPMGTTGVLSAVVAFERSAEKSGCS